MSMSLIGAPLAVDDADPATDDADGAAPVFAGEDPPELLPELLHELNASAAPNASTAPSRNVFVPTSYLHDNVGTNCRWLTNVTTGHRVVNT
jgi:hypothetical protein